MLDVDRAVSIIDPNGNPTSEVQTASIFADHFSSVYNFPLERGSYNAPLVNVVNHISKIVITEHMILQQLEFIDESKSPRPDGIHPNLLKRFSKDFANILYYIFNKSLEPGILPSDWKSANTQWVIIANYLYQGLNENLMRYRHILYYCYVVT